MAEMNKPMTPGGSRIAWSAEEDAILLKAVAENNGKNWRAVAAHLPNRTRAQCAHRFQKVLNPNIKKGTWTVEEDEKLLQAVEKNGPGKWSRIAESVPGRNGKQCRERWQNHLRGDVKKEPWSKNEDQLIIRLRQELGNKWAQIARHLPGRSENAVKNRWNAKLSYEVLGTNPPPTPSSKASNPSLSRTSSFSSTIPILNLPSHLAQGSNTCGKEMLNPKKRSASLLSVLSQVSSDSLATEGPLTPRTEGPCVKKQCTEENASSKFSELFSLPSNESKPSLLAKSSATELQEKLEALAGAGSIFSMGQFKKTDNSAPVQQVDNNNKPAGNQANTLEWLANLAAAQLLSSMTANKLE